MTDDEKIELAELLQYRSRSHFSIRRERMENAERRLGLFEGDRVTGRGLAEVFEAARHGKPLTIDEFIVTNLGFLPGECQAIERGKR